MTTLVLRAGGRATRAQRDDGNGIPHPPCILIVDDDAAARASLAEVVGLAGYRVREAVDGKEALRAAQEERPALVVLEVCLPDFCGYSVCRQIKDEFGDDLPIVLMSGRRSEPVDRVAGLLVGADEYLVKPFAPDELLLRASRLIQRSERVVPSLTRLTPRELEILGLLVQGFGQKHIARELVLSPRTVGTYIERLYKKLGVRSRAQAVAVAFREALVDRS